MFEVDSAVRFFSFWWSAGLNAPKTIVETRTFSFGVVAELVRVVDDSDEDVDAEDATVVAVAVAVAVVVNVVCVGTHMPHKTGHSGKII